MTHTTDQQGRITTLFTSVINDSVEDPHHPAVERIRHNGLAITAILDRGFKECGIFAGDPHLRYEIKYVDTPTGRIPVMIFQVYLDEECQGPYLFEACLLLITCHVDEAYTPVDKQALLDDLVTSYEVSDIYDPIKQIIKPDDVVIARRNDLEDSYYSLTLLRGDVQTILTINHTLANQHMAQQSTTN